jgi:cell division protein FtsZ
LLEGVELSGARCVIINITVAKSTLKMSEVREAVRTVQAFAAPEAFVKYGTVPDDSMEDRMRVTVIATGLGSPRSVRQEPQPFIHVVRNTGTYGPINADARAREGYDGTDITKPAVFRSSRRNRAESMMSSGGVRSSGSSGSSSSSSSAGGTYDIPAFLRRQAD